MSDLVKNAVAKTEGKVLEYLKNPTQGQTFGHLKMVLGFTGPIRRVDGVAESRILDRALQHLRKSGKIRYEGRQWILSESGRDLSGMTEDFKVRG